MVIDDIEYDGDAGFVQRRHSPRSVGHAVRRRARIEGKKIDRVVAPGISQTCLCQMAFVDPGRDRHQLDCIDAEIAQMRDDRRMGERRQSAAVFGRHVRVAHRKTPNIDLVDQPAGRKPQRFRAGVRWRFNNRLRHQAGSVDRLWLRQCQTLVIAPGTVDAGRIRVEQQLCPVETQPLLRLPRAFRAIAIARSCAGSWHEQRVDVARPIHRLARYFAILFVEQAKPDDVSIARKNTKRHAIVDYGRTESTVVVPARVPRSGIARAGTQRKTSGRSPFVLFT